MRNVTQPQVYNKMVPSIRQVLDRLPTFTIPQIPPPPYTFSERNIYNKVGMAVESMKYHMTDEGWQLFAGLQHAGYTLTGYNLPVPHTDCNQILEHLKPDTLVMQDKREWDTVPNDFRDQMARFTNVQELQNRHDIFKLTILKDAHQKPLYHRASAVEINAHAWITYYHADVIERVAPYIRKEHLVRTYHSLDKYLVARIKEEARGVSVKGNTCLLSGAISGVYPFRKQIREWMNDIPGCFYHKHPGYHRMGCMTPEYFRVLQPHKIAICTASTYGYALRKIIEATAMGCIVVTDLPYDDVLPEIDDNLVRVTKHWSKDEFISLIKLLYQSYDPFRQEMYSQKAMRYYHYEECGKRLDADIEKLRMSYKVS